MLKLMMWLKQCAEIVSFSILIYSHAACAGHQMKKTAHKINPLIVIRLERLLAQLESAEFHSREYSVVLPELIAESLRIIREVKP